uniref:Charged multivesicular body protein 6 n=1 Tax=Knipowitschia caucasica TaxID=637954 RepID=A0AAV2KJE2_KNICA
MLYQIKVPPQQLEDWLMRFQESSQCTPAALMFGRELRTPVDLVFGSPRLQEGTRWTISKDSESTCGWCMTILAKFKPVPGYVRRGPMTVTAAVSPSNLGTKCGFIAPIERKQLKQQRDKLKQYKKRITLQLEKERDLAKQLLRDGKKEKALLLLKKKRYQDQLLEKMENQISNLEQMVQDIEFMQIEMKVIEGLKVGNDCLKRMHEIMSIEDVERIMDETQEAIEYQRQIDDILAGSLTQEDEESILTELERITQGEVVLPEVLDEALPDIPEAAQVDKKRRKEEHENEMLAA